MTVSGFAHKLKDFLNSFPQGVNDSNGKWLFRSNFIYLLYPKGNKTNKWMKESACPFMAINYSFFKMIWVVKSTRLHTVTWEIIFFHILLYLLYFMLFLRLLHFVIFSVSGKEKDVLFILLENRNFRTHIRGHQMGTISVSYCLADFDYLFFIYIGSLLTVKSPEILN